MVEDELQLAAAVSQQNCPLLRREVGVEMLEALHRRLAACQWRTLNAVTQTYPNSIVRSSLNDMAESHVGAQGGGGWGVVHGRCY